MLDHISNEAAGKNKYVSLSKSNIFVHIVTDQSRFAQHVGKAFPGSSTETDTCSRMRAGLYM